MRRLPLLLMVLMLGCCGVAPGQVFDMQSQRVPLVLLDGHWRFHPGDDAAWANPNFDDSQWALLRSDDDWGRQGYPKLSGLAWYRFSVKVTRGQQHLSILLPTIMTSYEIYADGKWLGSVGKMPPNRMPYGGGEVEYFALPAPRPGSDTIEMALRVWQWQGWINYYGGGPQSGGGLVGDTTYIETEAQRLGDGNFRFRTLDLLMLIMEVLAGLGALTLFLMRRRDKEFLWLCLMLLASAEGHWMNFHTISSIANVELRDLINEIGAAIVDGATILFLLEVLRPKRNWLLKLAIASVVVSLVDGVFESISASYLSVGFDTVLSLVCQTVLSVWMISVAVASGKRNSIDARLLILPLLVTAGQNLVQGTAWATFTFGLQHRFDGFVRFTKYSFPIELSTVTEAIFLLGLSGILVLRFARARSEEERTAAEVRAAQEVQQYFIPSQLPAIPGFNIESAYRPAREVGGDFFQVLPQADDSVLVVLGDVAGKGLQAGMLATLIVGAVRTAAKFTTDPKQVMALLNERLLGRGLVTCLAMLIEKDGNTKLVNAGHLPPYLNGAELAVDGALPLGALAEIEFPMLRFKLAEGDSLMLMSDGIVEAQDAEGRLFGFDRIVELMHKSVSAADVAEAAQDFGQEDDITVLKVARLMPAMAG